LTQYRKIDAEIEGVSIDFKFPSAPVIVYGDRLRLEQVLVILIQNAIDATHEVERPRIVVEIKTAQK